jgi:two-component system phosphate regulon response regulator PhoB
MARDTILIIEDDPDIVELLQYNLEREGYAVLTASNGEVGLQDAQTRRPGLVLLDLMLPAMDGLDVCRQLKQREETREIPLIMVTAKGEEADVVSGLELGADDYISKPFSPREVVARVRAVLRRGQARGARKKTRIELGDVTLDLERFEVCVRGEVVPFTRAEFRLLWALMSSPGRVFTRDDLVERLTDGEAVILDRNVDVHVSAIRKKLGDEAALIGTVRGVGYKFKD